MKIIVDTGYQDFQVGRCYSVGRRTLTFSPDTTTGEVQAFIDAEKKAWYGQEFSAEVSGTTVKIRRGVDSGD